MTATKRRVIHVVSHGPACLDGVVAAATVGRFYRNQKVVPMFPSNSDSDRIIQGINPRASAEGHELWITDLSWTNRETGDHLTRLTEGGTRVFWIDHHRTAVSRAGGPEFQAPFAGKGLSVEFFASSL